MNTKLFKKLSEKVEIITIKNNLTITESDEKDLIFNNKGNVFNEFTEYNFAKAFANSSASNGSYKEPRDEDKERRVEKNLRKERKAEQHDYDADFEDLDDRASDLFDELSDTLDDMKYAYRKYKASHKSEDLDEFNNLNDEYKDLLKDAKKLEAALAELNSEHPSGIKIETHFTKLTRQKIRMFELDA